MKKVVSLLLLLCMAVGMFGCGKAQKIDPNAIAGVTLGGETKYVLTVEELVNAIDPSGNSVVTLLKDVETKDTIKLPYSCTIDFAGHTIATDPKKGIGLIVEEAALGPECGGVECRIVLIRTLFTVAHQQSVNEAGEHFTQRVGIQSQALQRGRTGIGQEHISLCQQLVQGIHTFLGLQIQGDMLLAGVVQVIDGVVVIVVHIRHIHTDGLTPHIAACCLDLNYLRAQISQQSAANGCCHEGGQFHNTNAL